ncbi:hypothetical protein HYALB_00001964 [Hymenoscyphus albidus]|uniref:DUF7907 domain-containing protein n=1 Tax=Hymenoscyphus albidus TaxID=595503 RepID=A0A9N9LDQ6_9HELO|nr:hypothetical protein HYALB_00001964 [Hymenoscyphus albidus]
MMVSIQILSLLLWTFGLTAALGDNKRDIIPTGPVYKLIAKGNDGDTRFDGLELTAYHSFAGQADAVFTNKTNFAGGWLNDTTPLFHFGGPNDWQAGLNLNYSTVEMYDAWYVPSFHQSL